MAYFKGLGVFGRSGQAANRLTTPQRHHNNMRSNRRLLASRTTTAHQPSSLVGQDDDATGFVLLVLRHGRRTDGQFKASRAGGRQHQLQGRTPSFHLDERRRPSNLCVGPYGVRTRVRVRKKARRV